MADTVAPVDPIEATTPAALGQDAASKQRAALEQRVTAKWDALIKNDFATAYTFTSPAYRHLHSLEYFKSRFGGTVKWRRVAVAHVDFIDKDAATVGINIHFVYYLKETGETFNMENDVKESWVHVNGQWWYVMKE